MSTIKAAPSDKKYIESHVDGDRVTSIRAALSVVVDKAKKHDADMEKTMEGVNDGTKRSR